MFKGKKVKAQLRVPCFTEFVYVELIEFLWVFGRSADLVSLLNRNVVLHLSHSFKAFVYGFSFLFSNLS